MVGPIKNDCSAGLLNAGGRRSLLAEQRRRRGTVGNTVANRVGRHATLSALTPLYSFRWTDATHFADRIVFPYEPKQIFLRSGGNDIHAGRLPAEVADDFADFVRQVRTRLPSTEIIFIGQCPTPARWGERDKNRQLNSLVRAMALRMPRVTYIDGWDMTLTPDKSNARRELFVADQLHFNAEGYKLLAERVRPYLPVIAK